MQVEEIRKRLNLRPHDEVEFDAFLRLPRMLEIVGYTTAVQGRYRGTGRTTEMLLIALSDVSEGKSVLVIAHSNAFAKMLETILDDWADQLGFNKQLIKTRTINSSKLITDSLINIHKYLHIDQLHIDHYVKELQAPITSPALGI